MLVFWSALKLTFNLPNDSRADKKGLVDDEKEGDVFIVPQYTSPVTDKQNKIG